MFKDTFETDVFSLVGTDTDTSTVPDRLTDTLTIIPAAVSDRYTVTGPDTVSRDNLTTVPSVSRPVTHTPDKNTHSHPGNVDAQEHPEPVLAGRKDKTTRPPHTNDDEDTCDMLIPSPQIEDYLQPNRTQVERGRSPTPLEGPLITLEPGKDVTSSQVQRGDAGSSIASAGVKNSNVESGGSPKTTLGPTPARKSCVYNKKGRCKEHGDGARKIMKPIITTEEGPDGKVIRKLTKKQSWRCDLGPNGDKKLTQTRLSFDRTPLRVNRVDGGDTQQGNLGNVMTSKEGQSGKVTVETGSDEN